MARLDPSELQRLREDIRVRFPVSSVAGRTLKLQRAGNELKACCPFHPDRTPSFTIYAGDRRWHCFGPCGDGDVIDYVAKEQGIGFRDAIRMLDSGALPVVAPQPIEHEPEDRDTVAEARAIWRNAAPIKGTLAENYLRSRGLWLPIPESLRFARLRYGKRGREHPCLVALVASVDNRAIGIQRTYLNAAGTGKAAVPKAKLSLGNVKGGAIRLAPAAAEMTVCEGLEDRLTLQQEQGRAVLVAAGAGMLPAMRLPTGVNRVIIGADADEAGERAARKAADAFRQQRRDVRIIQPLEGFKDFNDELRGIGQ